MVEIYALKPLGIKENFYINTALTVNGIDLIDSLGCDRYEFTSIITSGKRVAGLGREFFYTLSSFSAGMGAIEARPGKYFEVGNTLNNIALKLETNYITEIEVLSSFLGVRLVNEQGKCVSIPFARPDLLIQRSGKGQYTVPLSLLDLKKAIS